MKTDIFLDQFKKLSLALKRRFKKEASPHNINNVLLEAAEAGDLQTTRLLAKKAGPGNPWSPLQQAILAGNMKLVRVYTDETEIDINSVGYWSGTEDTWTTPPPLLLAFMVGKKDIFDLLLMHPRIDIPQNMEVLGWKLQLGRGQERAPLGSWDELTKMLSDENERRKKLLRTALQASQCTSGQDLALTNA